MDADQRRRHEGEHQQARVEGVQAREELPVAGRRGGGDDAGREDPGAEEQRQLAAHLGGARAHVLGARAAQGAHAAPRDQGHHDHHRREHGYEGQHRVAGRHHRAGEDGGAEGQRHLQVFRMQRVPAELLQVAGAAAAGVPVQQQAGGRGQRRAEQHHHQRARPRGVGQREGDAADERRVEGDGAERPAEELRLVEIERPHAGQPVGHDDHGRDVDDRPERVYSQHAAQVGAEAARQRGIVRVRRPVQQPQQGDRGQHRQDGLVLPQDAVDARRRPAARAPEQRGQPRRHEDQRLHALPPLDAAPQQRQGDPRRRRRGQRGHGGRERAGDGQHEHAGNHRPRDLLRAAGRRRLRAPAGLDVGCRFGQGATQIGDDQARSWMVAGRSGRGSTPARTASHVDQRHDGFSSTRT